MENINNTIISDKMLADVHGISCFLEIEPSVFFVQKNGFLVQKLKLLAITSM